MQNFKTTDLLNIFIKNWKNALKLENLEKIVI